MMDLGKGGVSCCGLAKFPATSKNCTSRVHVQSRDSEEQENAHLGHEPHATPGHAAHKFGAVIVKSMNAHRDLGEGDRDLGKSVCEVDRVQVMMRVSGGDDGWMRMNEVGA